MSLLEQLKMIKTEKVHLRIHGKYGDRAISLLVLSPKEGAVNAPGVLWIHGGGYITGMKEMIYMSRAMDLVTKYGAVVVAPDYRLAPKTPYPGAIKDCYLALLYMKKNAKRLGIRENQLMVGGESAGGGLTAAVCMLARDRGEVNIAYQMPLYPMLDNFDTESSVNNHGKVWNTKLNHFGWRQYLGRMAKEEVSPYASPTRQTDYRELPPCYTFVGDGEPFFFETLDYVANLIEAGVPAHVDVYPTDVHAFDMLLPRRKMSKLAAERFNERFEHAMKNCFAAQN